MIESSLAWRRSRQFLIGQSVLLEQIVPSANLLWVQRHLPRRCCKDISHDELDIARSFRDVTYTVNWPRTLVIGRLHSWAIFLRVHGAHGTFRSHLIFRRPHSRHERDILWDSRICSAFIARESQSCALMRQGSRKFQAKSSEEYRKAG